MSSLVTQKLSNDWDVLAVSDRCLNTVESGSCHRSATVVHRSTDILSTNPCSERLTPCLNMDELSEQWFKPDTQWLQTCQRVASCEWERTCTLVAPGGTSRVWQQHKS